MPNPPVRDRSKIVRLIGALHLAKAVLVLGAALNVLRLLSPGATQAFADWLADLPFAEENNFMQRVIEVVANLPPHRVQQLALAGFLYAALFFAEGIGLLLGRIWAEYLTIVATGSLIPFEVYEVLRKVTWIRVLALAANIIMVLYLVAHRVRAHRTGARG